MKSMRLTLCLRATHIMDDKMQNTTRNFNRLANPSLIFSNITKKIVQNICIDSTLHVLKGMIYQILRDM